MGTKIKTLTRPPFINSDFFKSYIDMGICKDDTLSNLEGKK